MPITTDSELLDFLISKDISCDRIETLTGGSANFCWRIKAPYGTKGATQIVKHAEPFVRVMPNMPLSVSRLDNERWALDTIKDPKLTTYRDGAKLNVSSPHLHGHFPEEHTIVMSDGGSQDLKEGYKSDHRIDIPLVGQRLGIWLGKIHSQTSTPPALKAYELICDSEFAKSVFRYTYDGVASVLKQHGHDPALGERINAKFGIEADSERTCLCHGDFWLSNIQLEDREPITDSEQKGEMREEEEKRLRAPALTVIDWENVRIGNGATDVARFAADAWLLDRFHGDRGLFEAFLKAYLAERPLERHDKIRLVVHFAVHIIFYSRMRWTDEASTRELVKIGKMMLEAVETDDLESLATGPLAFLFSEPQ